MPEIESRESWLFERRIEGRISGSWLGGGEGRDCGRLCLGSLVGWSC